MKVAVLASSGIDSTYALYSRLKDTEDDVTVTHFDFSIPQTESNAPFIDTMKTIVSWLSENVRPVNLEIVPIQRYTLDGWWATELIFWVAAQCKQRRFDEVITGWCGENFSPNRALVLRKLQKALFTKLTDYGKLSYPIETLTKIEMISELPVELKDLTLSCIYPVRTNNGWKNCRVCRKCRRTVYAEELLLSNLPTLEKRKMFIEKIKETPLHGGRGYRQTYPQFLLWNLLDE